MGSSSFVGITNPCCVNENCRHDSETKVFRFAQNSVSNMAAAGDFVDDAGLSFESQRQVFLSFMTQQWRDSRTGTIKVCDQPSAIHVHVGSGRDFEHPVSLRKHPHSLSKWFQQDPIHYGSWTHKREVSSYR